MRPKLPPTEGHEQVHAANAAFTLAELLVIIGVLAVWVLLLVPALARTRVSDRAFECQNNLRQLMNGWRMYAEDNADRVVNNWDTASILNDLALPTPTYGTWVDDVMNWNLPPPNDCFNLGGITNAPFYSYVNNVSVYKCPADNYLSTLQQLAGYTARPRSYSMNGFFGAAALTDTSGENEFYPLYQQFLKVSEIPDPANIYVLLDEHPDNINDGYFKDSANPNIASSMDWPGGVWGDVPASNHDGAAGFGFADGHAEIHLWTSRKCTILPVRYQPVPHNSLLSDPTGIADAAWLASHSSVPN